MLLFLLLSSHFSLCEFGSYNATKNDSDTSSFFDEKLFLNFFPFFFFFPLEMCSVLCGQQLQDQRGDGDERKKEQVKIKIKKRA